MFHSTAISKQLNEVPYQWHRPWQLLPCQRWLVHLRFHMFTSLAPRPVIVVFGLGTRLCVRMHTTFENDVLRNGQQLGRAMNSLIDFVAMKMVSARKAPRCDKHQFCDKMTVNT